MKCRLLLSSLVAVGFLALPGLAQEKETDPPAKDPETVLAAPIIPHKYLLDADAQDEKQDAEKPAQQKREPIYHDDADARADIAKALAKAKKENRRVLIQWGANWCGWCYLLNDHFKENREVARKMLYEYDLVHVDVGRGEKNRDLAEKYEAKLQGFPYLTVLSAEGEVIANQETGSLELKGSDVKGHDPEKVMAFLTEHQALYLSAESVLYDAIKLADEESKRVYVHFGAPWCGWCHKLEAWLAQEDVAKVFGKYFVEVKIDTDRTIGGQELYAKLSEKRGRGIPWSAVLDAEGNVAAPGFFEGSQNIGHPVTDEEIEGFLAMLKKGAPNLSDKDAMMLKKSLIAARDKK